MNASIPAFPSITLADIETHLSSDGILPMLGSLPPVSERGTAFIIHSSGTTSGMPKLIPSNHLWVKNFVELKYASCLEQGSFIGQSVCNSIGNLNHVGSLCGKCTLSPCLPFFFLIADRSMLAFLGAAYNGACTVQSSSMAFSTDELLGMITHCGLNRLLVYATFLSIHIRNAQKDEKVLKMMRNLRQILHTGVALHREDEEWAFSRGLPLTVYITYISPQLYSLIMISIDIIWALGDM